MQNDMALIRLIQPAIFNFAVQPAKLPEPFETFNNLSCVVSGWGVTAEGRVSFQISVLYRIQQTYTLSLNSNFN